MRTDKDIMITRWSKALHRIRTVGGPLALLEMPEPVRDILKNTEDLTAKTRILEAIADAMTAGKI